MKIENFGPFAIRSKLTSEEREFKEIHNIVYISDKDGNDWYALQKKFRADTLKFVFDTEGLINAASFDATSLWPDGYYVAEILKLPKKFSLPIQGGCWVFNGETITEKTLSEEEVIEQRKVLQQTKQSHASNIIAPLQDAVDLDMANDEEKAQLTAWKKYRVLLNRMDISRDDWPESPNI